MKAMFVSFFFLLCYLDFFFLSHFIFAIFTDVARACRRLEGQDLPDSALILLIVSPTFLRVQRLSLQVVD